MVSTAQLRRLVEGAENSFGVDLGWPGVPDVGSYRPLVVLGSLIVAAAVVAIYGDTVVTGTAGRLLAFGGLLGVVVVTPAFLARCLTGGRSGSGDRWEGANGFERYR